MNIHSTKRPAVMNQEQESKRDRIIRATVKLVATYGFHGTPVSMITREAEVGAGSIYRYFEDKDALLHEIFKQLQDDLKQQLFADYDESQPIRDRFFHLCRGIFRYGQKNPHEFKFIEQYLHSPYGINLRRDNLFCDCLEPGKELPLKHLFTAGQKASLIKKLPVPALLALTIGPIIFLVKDHLAGLLELDDATMDTTIAACWNAIKNEGAPE
jgi:AcrR family transcriptional regulator